MQIPTRLVCGVVTTRMLRGLEHEGSVNFAPKWRILVQLATQMYVLRLLLRLRAASVRSDAYVWMAVLYSTTRPRHARISAPSSFSMRARMDVLTGKTKGNAEPG